MFPPGVLTSVLTDMMAPHVRDVTHCRHLNQIPITSAPVRIYIQI